jgi:hypothetical protein
VQRNLGARNSVLRTGCLLMAGLIPSSIVMAQSAPPMPPQLPALDSNSVSITDGYNDIPFFNMRIGPEQGGIPLTFSSRIDASGDDIFSDAATNIWSDMRLTRYQISPALDATNISLLGQPDFQTNMSGGAFTGNNSIFGNGSRITGDYYNPVYESRDGTKFYFTPQPGQNPAGGGTLYYYLDRMERPNGEIWKWSYEFLQVAGLPTGNTYGRITSVVSNLGYQIKVTRTPLATWNITGRTYQGINNAYEYCSPTASCTFSLTWPYVSQVMTTPSSIPTRTFSASGSRTVVSANPTTSPNYTVRTQSSSYTNMGYTITDGFDGCASGADPRFRVTAVNVDGQIWSYAWNNNSCSRTSNTLTVTDPQSKQTVYTYKPPSGAFGPVPSSPALLQSIKDPLNRTTLIEYDSWFRKTKITAPDLSWWQFTYDARGNLTSRVRYPTPASGLPSITEETSTFPATCDNYKTCNKPDSVTDANGNVTNYTYSPDHGGVLTKTGPAVGGIRPQTRYEYVQRYAWVKNAAGAYVQAATPIWLLATERTCRTTATTGNSCAGGATDEVVTSYDYGPDSGPNNLLKRGVIVAADSQSLRTCFNYDRFGNKISETKPAAGLTACP